MIRATYLAGLLAIIGIIGLVDFWTGPAFGFSLFYLVPIAIAGWRAGQPVASIVASGAAATWLAADVSARPDTLVVASVWNGFTRLVLFNAVALLLVRLRRELARHEEIGRIREEMLYSVAHELRNPLGVLENALDILTTERADLSSGESQRLLASARRTAARLHALMEDLLSAGSIRSGRFAIRSEPVSLSTVLADAAEIVDASLRDRAQTLSLDVPEDLVVRVDPRYAKQVLINLIGNASKYGPRDAAIRVLAERTHGEARVVVEDQGPGIPAGQHEEIFQRFYRRREEGHQPGIGLGLAIAKGIVEAHGGRIGIESSAGDGTRVWFTLPLVEAGS